MIEVPALTPVSRPELLPIVATDVVPLIQVPPATLFVSVLVCVAQITVEPPIAPGLAFTVTFCVTKLPPKVYVMVTVPAVTPVTIPPPVIVAIAVLLLAHVPPVAALARVMLFPVQTEKGAPVIAVSSDTDELPVFHLSPGSAPPVFTALINPLSVTAPVPDAGAVHGTVTTYVVPAPPLPDVAPIADPCSVILMPAAVARCVVPPAVPNVPTEALLPFTAET